MGRKNKPGEHAQTFRLPSDVWQNLCRSAENNLRSRNGELVWILREWFKERGRDKRGGTGANTEGPADATTRPSGS
jgi:hypothetical protein